MKAKGNFSSLFFIIDHANDLIFLKHKFRSLHCKNEFSEHECMIEEVTI